MSNQIVRRHWSRFSLRAMLIGVLACSVALGWFSLRLNKARWQAHAAGELQRQGATLYYDHHHYYDENGDGCLSPSRKPTDWISARRLLGDDFFSDIYSVCFIKMTPIPTSPLGSQAMHWLGPVPSSTAASRNADNYIYLLKSFPNLNSLDLSDSAVTDESIPALAELKTLKRLRLQNTSVSKDGFVQLQELMPTCDIYWR